MAGFFRRYFRGFNLKKLGRLSVLCMVLLCVAGVCSGCGKKTAATMRLVKTLGQVAVDDAKQKSVKIFDNLALFDGYHVATGRESFAWVNLDDAKLTKMDSDSDVTVRKKGKKLELMVGSGSLYFRVTEPLDADETMNICTSTMIIGIRGTEGWVEVLSENHMRAYLLEGTVECTVSDESGNVLATAFIEAGEMADMIFAGGDSVITTERFVDVPEFVAEEFEEEERNSFAPNREYGEDAEENGAAGGGADFSIKFGGVEITGLPIDMSVLENDGWYIDETDADGISYAGKGGDFIALEFVEGSETQIETIYLRNGNYKYGIFDISKITLFGTVDFASSTSADIKEALDSNGDQGVSLYECLIDNYDAYYFELYHQKGLTSCCIVKDGDTDFNIGLSCASAGTEENSNAQSGNGDTGDGQTAGDDERPKTVEHRWYKSSYNESQTMSVEILDNGGWSMEIEGWGAMAVYISYSFEMEAAGEYAQVSGYDMGGEEPQFEYMGRAKFKMTEDELTMQYEDEDEPEIYYRTY